MTAPLGDDLRIAICGAGMGGLAAALSLGRAGFAHIDVYETAKDLGFVGAGIQVAPNLSRILKRMEVWDEMLRADAVEMKETSIRECTTDEELCNVKLDHVEKLYGMPHCVAHRSDLANALFTGCKSLSPKITFHFSTTAENVDFDRTRLLVRPRGEQDGKWEEYDLIIGADGIKSRVRECMLKRNNEESVSKDTGQASYRIMLRREEMQNDPELLALVSSNTLWRWIGPKRHIIAYPISRNTIFNISSAQPDVHFAPEASATWTTRASKQDMLDVYSDYCPLVKKMLEKVPEGEVCEWKLRSQHPLRTWVEERVVLLGDACHPTLPHLNQGAAMAIEDGAVLAVVLSKIHSKEDIHAALVVYQNLRKSRTESLVEQAAESGRRMHLTSPADQAERNEAFRQVKHGGPNPDRAVDRDVQKFVYGHDCVKDAEERWEGMFAEVKAELEGGEGKGKA